MTMMTDPPDATTERVLPPECRVLTLIGYRGCGKSTVAPRLAVLLGWDWVDCDDEVERAAGQSIRAIFAQSGEAHFRELETSILHDLLSRTQLIIAAGGGAVLAEVNRRRMREAGPVVWLRASEQTLARRIRTDTTTNARRPSLTGGDVVDEIREVLAVREPLYLATAGLIVDVERLTPDEAAAQIAAHTRCTPPGPTRDKEPNA